MSRKKALGHSDVTSPSSKKLQRSVHNQTSPSLKGNPPLKLRRHNLTDPLTLSTIIDQCGTQASHVTHLDISYSLTASTTLKFFCSRLDQLQTLTAVECNLSHIAEDTPWPPCLHSIDLSRNKLTCLPHSLNNLLELTKLNLSGNLISALDSALLALPKLQKIQLLNNPIQNVPKSVCREGVQELRQYFKVTPLGIPSPDKMPREKQLDLRRYALHNQGSTDSAYESHRKASFTSGCYSTSLSSFSDVDSIGSFEEEWPQFEPDTLPDGYNEAVLSNLCQVYLPDECDVDIEIEIIKDISLHPKIKPNELLISPVLRISPHGTKFLEGKPAIIVLTHCTRGDNESSMNIVPLCSNTGLDHSPYWEKLSDSFPETSNKIFQDRVMFSTTHFSLFAVVASIPYPSKSLLVSANEEHLLEMQELPGFRVQIPCHSVPSPTVINTTIYYTDPPFIAESLESSPASVCIGVEPHGIHFESPVVVSIPIPDFNKIKELLPGVELVLYHSSDSTIENGSLKWNPSQNQHYELSTEDDSTVATFDTMHFSLFEFIWTVGQDALNKIGVGASNAYKYLTSRRPFVSVRWQAFMTSPLSDLSFGLALCVYKFGEPLKELSNYPWHVGDSGPKRVYLRVGELKVSLQGHFTASQDMNESLEQSTTVVDFRGDDFCARMDFALRLCDGVAFPLQDGQILGKLTFTQMNDDRPTVMSYNLIKPNTDTTFTRASSPSTSTTPRGCTPTYNGLTPPWTNTDVQMDCDDVFVNPLTPRTSTCTSPRNACATQPPPINRKHQRQEDSLDIDTPLPTVKGAKRRLFLKMDDITDRTLMEISRAACSKYVELGIQLNLPYNVIHSTVGAEGTSTAEHLKMFYVLQEWKGRAASDFTFETLSKALEGIGLASVAQSHCYTSNQ